MEGLNALKLGLDEKFYEESPVVAMESEGHAILLSEAVPGHLVVHSA